MNAAHPDELSAVFAALSDPTRRAIVARLAAGEATVSELAAPFEISLPAVSRHLRVLEDAGLIRRTREAQRRRCALAPERLDLARDWVDRYRRFWSERFDRLAAALGEAAPDKRSKGERHGRRRG
jgi:DNA-binding transcriptional ArsR family regulator